MYKYSQGKCVEVKRLKLSNTPIDVAIAGNCLIVTQYHIITVFNMNSWATLENFDYPMKADSLATLSDSCVAVGKRDGTIDLLKQGLNGNWTQTKDHI